ncbi:MAG: 30S ribosome-binding factor RbfA, partial [Lachnospiraceae bacterium]|nr:30S ribosome-binding factor RbfA [Lachnospiraceae bacterium]
CISLMGDEKSLADTLAVLKSAEGYIRNQLARTINLRNTPQITFIMDQSIAYGVNMSKLIDEVVEKSRSGNLEEDEMVEGNENN